MKEIVFSFFCFFSEGKRSSFFTSCPLILDAFSLFYYLICFFICWGGWGNQTLPYFLFDYMFSFPSYVMGKVLKKPKTVCFHGSNLTPLFIWFGIIYLIFFYYILWKLKLWAFSVLSKLVSLIFKKKKN